MMYNKLLIVDGSFLLHRSLHLPQLWELRDHTGRRSGGVFGFIRSLNAELKKNGLYFPVVCWDSKLSPRRVKADPYYKHANERDNTPEILTEEEMDNDYITQYRKQRGILINILDYCGIPSLRYSGVEGDDLMYLLTTMSNEARVLTDDRDMLQLLAPNVSVRRPKADELITYQQFLDDNHFDSIYDFVCQKAICGDGSDNIPGSAAGVGAGTSLGLIKILQKYNYTDEWLTESDNDLKDYCKSLGLSYRKAYKNFDLKRFQTNLELVDLNLVANDTDDEFKDTIRATIDSCRSTVNFFGLAQLLGSLDIKEIAPDEIMNNVAVRYKSLMENLDG